MLYESVRKITQGPFTLRLWIDDQNGTLQDLYFDAIADSCLSYFLLTFNRTRPLQEVAKMLMNNCHELNAVEITVNGNGTIVHRDEEE